MSSPISSSPTSTTGPVRVRFAPSPTGYLHVGGARTALFNWLFARHHGGVFVLRIEDTDLDRSTAESEEGLLRDLRWLGLDWDEGPGVGGPHAPYRQSERRAIYQNAARALLEAGKAYPCFCPEELLEAKRKAAEAAGAPLHYDGTCRRLAESEVRRRIAAGEPYAIRMAVPPHDMVLDDLIRGRVEWKADTLGDFIILRSNGMPVYNFCVVVDDAEMEITHVLRGDDHLTNTHRQLIIYEALGKPLPRFGHVSMILGPDKAKLSKRHGTTSIGQFAAEGYLPEAMVNYLALLGWSEGNDQEVYTREELIAKFSLERIGSSAAVFDQTKLAWMNGLHIRRLAPERLGKLVAPILREAWPHDARLADPAFLRKVALLLQNHLHVLREAPAHLKPVFEGGPPADDEAAAALAVPGADALHAAFVEELAKIVDWKRETINEALKAAGKKTGMKGKNLFMPIRAKLTGLAHGPDLGLIIDVLGLAEVRRRLLGPTAG
ncbi:MAG: Glutamyl-tRNA synthetase [Candidatus Ozemobacter sibiricus]|uniref:Glutamate--tRNA ligase n=1 Tax=Candidatus Ozemobacter sibiricus TaxID=2268124 RepID=A0A367ZI63_9BACT|nr:MAG: Glutamyl-tRNA synthetase [Candidatus Ozemobacter sibiricus]